MGQITLPFLINSNYSQLLRWRPLTNKNSIEEYYCRIMSAYYQNSIFRLENIIKELSNIQNKKYERYKNLAIFRLKMVKGELTSTIIHSFKEKFNQEETSLKGDILFACALSMYKIKQFNAAKDLFIKSSLELKQYGAIKKSLLSYMNAITMFGNMDSRQRQIADHLKYIRVCKKHNATETLAVAYCNIADEYYKLGAYTLASEYIKECLHYSKSEIYSHQWYEYQAMEIEVLFALGCKKLATEKLAILNECKHEEIKDIVKIIKHRHLAQELTDINIQKLSPPWRLKACTQKQQIKLTRLESILLRELGLGAIFIDELAQSLYGEIDLGDAKNRLTTLVTRINKKQSNIIRYNKNTNMLTLTFNESIDMGNFDEL